MTPKLTYFNGRGLAELIRLLCKYGDIEFEDKRIEREEWPALKPNTPFGQVPLYEEDGKVVGQSLAIARYIAKKVKLVGANDWEDLEIDAIVDTMTDLRLKCAPVFREEDATKKAELMKTLETETIPYYLDRLNKLAEGGYMVENKLTWADFCVFSTFDSTHRMTGKDIDTKYSNLYKVKDNVMSIPKIKKWIETRPETPF